MALKVSPSGLGGALCRAGRRSEALPGTQNPTVFLQAALGQVPTNRCRCSTRERRGNRSAVVERIGGAESGGRSELSKPSHWFRDTLTPDRPFEPLGKTRGVRSPAVPSGSQAGGEPHHRVPSYAWMEAILAIMFPCRVFRTRRPHPVMFKPMPATKRRSRPQFMGSGTR